MPVKASQQPDSDTQMENVLAQAAARDRVNLEKHLAICDAEPDPSHAKLWRRLMIKVAGLVPLPVRTSGPHAAQFFIADGKYRMQVFVVEDNCDGFINLYLQNIIAKAVSEKLLVKKGTTYSPPGVDKPVLAIEQLDSRHPMDPPEFIKHMLGWNRKAMKITLPVSEPNNSQVAAAESLCVLAAKQWVNNQVPAATK